MRRFFARPSVFPHRMVWMFAAAVMFPMSFAAGEISADATREAVIARLGAPAGEIVVGDRTILYFPRGSVQMQEGRVTAADLISEAELREQQVAAEERRALRDERPAREHVAEQARLRLAESRLAEVERRLSEAETQPGPVRYVPVGTIHGFRVPGYLGHGLPHRFHRHQPRGPFVQWSAPRPDDSLRARAAREYEESRRETLLHAWERRGPMALHGVRRRE